MADDSLPPRLLRSALFVPGDKPRALTKAPGLNADALIVDLEDAVAPERKADARAAAPGAIAAFKRAGAFSLVRVAAPDAAELAADAEAAAAAEPDAVCVAKVEDEDALDAARAALRRAGYDGPLWAMIETPRAVLALREIVARAARTDLAALVAGTNDLAKALRLPEGESRRAALRPHLAQIVLAARAGGLAALDGVYNAYTDPDGFEREARDGRALGFDGKTLIHPAQIGAANAVFAPDAADIAWAEAVITAFAAPENAGRGAIALDGTMVERLHLDHARAVLAAAGRLSA